MIPAEALRNRIVTFDGILTTPVPRGKIADKLEFGMSPPTQLLLSLQSRSDIIAEHPVEVIILLKFNSNEENNNINS